MTLYTYIHMPSTRCETCGCNSLTRCDLTYMPPTLCMVKQTNMIHIGSAAGLTTPLMSGCGKYGVFEYLLGGGVMSQRCNRTCRCNTLTRYDVVYIRAHTSISLYVFSSRDRRDARWIHCRQCVTVICEGDRTSNYVRFDIRFTLGPLQDMRQLYMRGYIRMSMCVRLRYLLGGVASQRCDRTVMISYGGPRVHRLCMAHQDDASSGGRDAECIVILHAWASSCRRAMCTQASLMYVARAGVN